MGQCEYVKWYDSFTRSKSCTNESVFWNKVRHTSASVSGPCWSWCGLRKRPTPGWQRRASVLDIGTAPRN